MQGVHWTAPHSFAVRTLCVRAPTLLLRSVDMMSVILHPAHYQQTKSPDTSHGFHFSFHEKTTRLQFPLNPQMLVRSKWLCHSSQVLDSGSDFTEHWTLNQCWTWSMCALVCVKGLGKRVFVVKKEIPLTAVILPSSHIPTHTILIWT